MDPEKLWEGRLLPHLVPDWPWLLQVSSPPYSEDGLCLYCSGKVDDALHSFFSCQRWVEGRERFQVEIGEFSPNSIIHKIVKRERSWINLSGYAHYVLRTKKSALHRNVVAETYMLKTYMFYQEVSKLVIVLIIQLTKAQTMHINLPIIITLRKYFSHSIVLVYISVPVVILSIFIFSLLQIYII